LTDIFAVQDDISSRVVAAIEPALSRAESQRVMAKRPEHMGAWDYCQRGLWYVHKATRTDGTTAYGLFKQALALDPNLADAHLGLARALIVQWDYGSVEDFAPFVREAREAALQALALDSENPQTQYVLAQTSHWAGDVRAAIAHANRAIELNENFAVAHFYLGIGLSLDGRHEEALDAIETGVAAQSPRSPGLHLARQQGPGILSSKALRGGDRDRLVSAPHPASRLWLPRPGRELCPTRA